MGNRGRYGKYGESKRLSRLREAKAAYRTTPTKGIKSKRDTPSRAKEVPTPPVHIRLARPTDISYVRDLSKRAFRQYGAYDSVLGQWFELTSTVALVAYQDSKSLGFAMLSRPPQNWLFPLASELLAIAVERSRWRKGIGDLLMVGVEGAAQRLQVEKLVLHTAVENLSAQALFKKHGFVPSQVKRGFYPMGQDALMMFKEI